MARKHKPEEIIGKQIERVFSTQKQPCRIATKSDKRAILAASSVLVQPAAAGDLNAPCRHVLAFRGFTMLNEPSVTVRHL